MRRCTRATTVSARALSSIERLPATCASTAPARNGSMCQSLSWVANIPQRLRTQCWPRTYALTAHCTLRPRRLPAAAITSRRKARRLSRHRSNGTQRGDRADRMQLGEIDAESLRTCFAISRCSPISVRVSCESGCVRTVSDTPGNPGQITRVTGNLDADRCCGNSLMRSALLPFGVRYCDQPEAILLRFSAKSGPRSSCESGYGVGTADGETFTIEPIATQIHAVLTIVN